ncbi:MAG: hypothetical protein IJR02_06775 [Bacteroidaceae bacterium]|nr:hypothetical protein [Bacteroidaceae bacterium]
MAQHYIYDSEGRVRMVLDDKEYAEYLAEQERLEQEEVKAKEKKYLGCLGVVVAIILYIFILSKCG